MSEQSDTDRMRVDLGLAWDVQRLRWFHEQDRSPFTLPKDAAQRLREIGESGLRRLYEADEISGEEFEQLFERLLSAVAA